MVLVRPRPGRHGTVVVDVVGLGGGVADALKADGYRVVEYNAGAAADDSDRFVNRGPRPSGSCAR